jgi:hypothetical protein
VLILLVRNLFIESSQRKPLTLIRGGIAVVWSEPSCYNETRLRLSPTEIVSAEQLNMLFGVLSIWCPKYRKDILIGHAAETLWIILETVGLEHSWSIIAKEIQPDHIHLFISVPPSIAVSELLEKIKGISARTFFFNFPK